MFVLSHIIMQHTKEDIRECVRASASYLQCVHQHQDEPNDLPKFIQVTLNIHHIHRNKPRIFANFRTTLPNRAKGKRMKNGNSISYASVKALDSLQWAEVLDKCRKKGTKRKKGRTRERKNKRERKNEHEKSYLQCAEISMITSQRHFSRGKFLAVVGKD